MQEGSTIKGINKSWKYDTYIVKKRVYVQREFLKNQFERENKSKQIGESIALKEGLEK